MIFSYVEKAKLPVFETEKSKFGGYTHENCNH